ALLNTIKTGNEEALAQRKATNAAMNEALKQNEDLRQQIGDKSEEQRLEVRKFEIELKKAQDKLREQEIAAKNPNRALVEPHALVLDLSKGKPLWDLPRAKITKVDIAAQRVLIDRGTKDGVKTGLTFTVFSASAAGRAA